VSPPGFAGPSFTGSTYLVQVAEAGQLDERIQLNVANACPQAKNKL
jgi:hypothetical protein